jgi:hypothetical protein
MTDEKAAAKDKSSSKESTKTESSSASSDAPANYSRGEGQKPVSAAYRENWNLIFGNKTTKPKTSRAIARKKIEKAKPTKTKKKKK